MGGRVQAKALARRVLLAQSLHAEQGGAADGQVWRRAGVHVEAALALFLVTAAVSPVRAADAGWSVPPGCPTRAEFEAQHGALSGRAFPGLPSVWLRVEATDRGYRGEVAAGPRATPRIVEGTSCAEVLSALALVASLMGDVDAQEAVAGAEVLPQALVRAATAEADDGAAPPPQSLARVAAVPTPRVDAPVLGSVDRHPGGWARAGLGMGLQLAIAPRALYTADLFVDLGRSAGPFVRVAAAGGASPASDVAGAEARFSAWIGRVAAAPVQVALGPVELFASGGLDAGLVFAEGVGGLEARGRTRTRWLTLRQALHVRLALGRAVDVELEAAMVEPLHRVTYVLNAPDAVVHRTPAVSAAFGLSFLYRPTPRNGRPLAFRDHGRLGRPIPP